MGGISSVGLGAATVGTGRTDGRPGLGLPPYPETLTVEVDVVAIADPATLASAWGKSRGEPRHLEAYDLDDDGVIWIGDLAILLESYQPRGVY